MLVISVTTVAFTGSNVVLIWELFVGAILIFDTSNNGNDVDDNNDDDVVDISDIPVVVVRISVLPVTFCDVTYCRQLHTKSIKTVNRIKDKVY